MALYSPPPPARPFSDDKPTLLTSWWLTLLCAFIIVVRLLGRCLRVEELFGEDKAAALALIPLFARMALVHPILLYGTNNVLLDERVSLADVDVWHRSIASRLVLVARVVQPTILWLLKIVTLRFFHHLVGHSGKNRYTLLLRFMWLALAATFLAVVVSDLAECRPFHAYWQVLPDPGAPCRQGYAHLLTVTVCDVLTDLLLVVFPVPIVVKSRLSAGRKVLLVALFCLHLLTAAVAVYRVTRIVAEGGYQGSRTMWASIEILVATIAANALAIGTFVRDTGVKKRRRPKYELAVSAMRSTRRDSRVAKTVAWEDGGSDDEVNRDGRAATSGTDKKDSTNTLKESESKETSRRPVIGRTESLDSLIPRSRSAASTPDTGGRVVKTTTIQVTVSAAGAEEIEQAKEVNGLILRPPDGLVTASVSGMARGSNVVLQEIYPVSDAGGHGRQSR